MSADDEPPEHRTVIRSSRFTPREWAAVEARAAAVRLSPSRYLRHAALGTPLGRRLNAEAVGSLNRVGVNLNNLVRLAIHSGQPLLADEAAEVLKLIRQRLESFL